MRKRARSSGPPVGRDAWLRLAACAAAAALLQMDGTIVTVALPSVGRELDVGSHTLAWVLTAYFLAYGLMLFPGGSLVDRIGSPEPTRERVRERSAVRSRWFSSASPFFSSAFSITSRSSSSLKGLVM